LYGIGRRIRGDIVTTLTAPILKLLLRPNFGFKIDSAGYLILHFKVFYYFMFLVVYRRSRLCGQSVNYFSEMFYRIGLRTMRDFVTIFNGTYFKMAFKARLWF
jgi:hypothetical protein